MSAEPGLTEAGIGVADPEPDLEELSEPAVPRRGDPILDPLNEGQREAVQHGSGPALVVAGAGSGKTRVLTHRIAHLIRDRGVNPFRLMAITFTNKAANEMKSRVIQLVGSVGERMWVSTFHRACVRILRHDAAKVGLPTDFTIYDAADQGRMVRAATLAAGLDPKALPPRTSRSTISRWKNELLTPAEAEAHSHNSRGREIAAIYTLYEQKLREAGGVDFDDLLMLTVRLLRADDESRTYHQQRWEHVLVDEFQDSNFCQNELVKLLAGGNDNVFVVGDSDQSIYAFRGAVPANFAKFEHTYPEAARYVLDQNYRSTQTILDAANSLIEHNISDHHKKLWNTREDNRPIALYRADDEADEAHFIAEQLQQMVDAGRSLADAAIFYRVNAQSRALEEALLVAGVPYTMVRGTGFYDRAEIRDAVAFVRLALNPADELAARRVVNKPRRGVGDGSLDKVAAFAASTGVSFLDALRDAGQAGLKGRALGGVTEFLSVVDHTQQLIANDVPPEDVLVDALEQSGYLADLRAENSVESQSKLENLEELVNSTRRYDNCAEMIEAISLISDADMLPDREEVVGAGRAPQDRNEAGDTADVGTVSLMTLHTSKGLEYEVVFMPGLEEGLLPHSMSMGDPDQLEEERRLAYVGITRAQTQLYLLHADDRFIPGSTTWGSPSRFLDEIPEHLTEDRSVRVIGSGRTRSYDW